MPRALEERESIKNVSLLKNSASVYAFHCSLALNVVRMFPWPNGVKFHPGAACRSGQH